MVISVLLAFIVIFSVVVILCAILSIPEYDDDEEQVKYLQGWYKSKNIK